MERDQIAEYRDRLRSGLLASRGRTQLILDEAEDHLRESAAAGMAAGLTEAEAQRAAIASFGSVRAVVGAPAAARHGAAIATMTEVVLAGWQLVAIYLLADFVAGLAWQLVGGRVIRLIWGVATSYPTTVAWVGAGVV